MERARGPGGQGQIVLGLVDLDERPGPSSKCSAEPPPPRNNTTPSDDARGIGARRVPGTAPGARRSANKAETTSLPSRSVIRFGN